MSIKLFGFGYMAQKPKKYRIEQQKKQEIKHLHFHKHVEYKQIGMMQAQ